MAAFVLAPRDREVVSHPRTIAIVQVEHVVGREDAGVLAGPRLGAWSPARGRVVDRRQGRDLAGEPPRSLVVEVGAGIAKRLVVGERVFEWSVFLDDIRDGLPGLVLERRLHRGADV